MWVFFLLLFSFASMHFPGHLLPVYLMFISVNSCLPLRARGGQRPLFSQWMSDLRVSSWVFTVTIVTSPLTWKPVDMFACLSLYLIRGGTLSALL